MRKMKREMFVFSTILLITTLFTINSITTKTANTKLELISSDLKLNSLTPHVAIYITHDSNFSDYGFPGLGTSSQPYRIENYNITTAEDVGIYIGGVDKYFIIQNCVINGNYRGIEIRDIHINTAETVSIAKIINNVCNGIYVYYSFNVEIADNYLITGGDRIYADHTINLDVKNNTCSNFGSIRGGTGITLIDCESSFVRFNNCTGMMRGIYLDNCDSIRVMYNYIEDQYSYGINVYESGDCTVDHNTVTDCGGYGILAHCFGSTFLIANHVSSNAFGIYMKTSTASTIKENICLNNIFGIQLDSSDSTEVTSNTLSSNLVGLKVVYSNYLTISNNYCSSNTENGMYFDLSKSLLITSNNCSSNKNNGMVLKVVKVSNITYNNCSLNGYYGINVDSSSNCKFNYNFFSDNDRYALYFNLGSSSNVISHNSFIDNNIGGFSQCFDDGSVNIWYDTKKREGNYWSDLGEFKTYAIYGFSESIDKYPLNESLERISAFLSISIITLLMIVFLKIKNRRKRKKEF